MTLPCALLFLIAAGVAPAQERIATVTAAVGDARGVGSERLASGTAIGENGTVQTGEDGGCSVLLKENALVELCGGTLVRLEKPSGGRRIVRVDAGEARIVVEPREFGERIEIHTPAAVATILGTIVYVTVDPETGKTTITSGDHDIVVRNSDRSVPGEVLITGGEQVTIESGKSPERRRLKRARFASLGGCLVDFHNVGLTVNPSVRQKQIARVIQVDIELPAVAAGPVQQPTVLAESGDPTGDETIPETVFTPTEVLPPPPPIVQTPPGCGIPGDHCTF